MIDGLKSLERKLARIPKSVEKHLKTALEIAADKVVATAETLVPEDQGDLKNSIGWVWGDDIPDGAFSLGSVSKSAGNDLRITVFAGSNDAFYARWVEFGTRVQPAQPYFFPAYRLQKRATRSRISRAIKKGLQETSR